MMQAARRQRRVLAIVLALLTLLLIMAGLAAGSDGWRLAWPWSGGDDWPLIVGQIRAPRTLGAWLVGALLGLAGAVAQGLFRNPLADPYLLGSAAGASLCVVLVLAAGAAGAAGGVTSAISISTDIAQAGVVLAAFIGALAGMLLTLMLARGASHTTRLLLAGVVVGVMLTAVSDLITTAVPQALRARQGFMLGNTAFLGWAGVAWMAAGLAVAAPVAWRLARVLDALALGEDSAHSLGLPLGRLRAALVGVLALATGLAVSQAGLVAFVGLVAPHLVRRFAPGAHGFIVLASVATGGALLLAADIASRSVMAPQELPVGVLTAILGGGYLLWLLNKAHRQPQDGGQP
jgi:iron complex transport system permease protein